MAKLAPEERWQKLVLERFTALRYSKDFRKARAQGLSILGQKKMFAMKEWVSSYDERISSPGYLEWCNGECRQLGERFGLASWVVSTACLARGYRPEKEPFVITSGWPLISVVTEATDQAFITKLSYEAQNLGLRVICRRGSSESTLVGPIMTPDVPVPDTKPPMLSAFQVRVEIPLGYPPGAARELQKKASFLARELLLKLGYRVPERLRTSSLTAMASQLEIDKAHLRSGRAYDIIDKVYGQGNLSEDQRRRGIVKVSRHRLNKRLKDIGDTQ